MRVLLTGAFKYNKGQLQQIQDLGYEIFFAQDERIPLGESLPELDVATIEAVVCNGLFLYNDIRAFQKLKCIQLTSAGLDRVPLDIIRNRGIRLLTARDVYSVPMAEWVVLKILEIYKNSRHFYRAQDEHRWDKRRDLLELSGKIAAILGFGSVGFQVAKRLKAFDVKVIAVDGKVLSSEEGCLLDEAYPPSEIDKVLEQSDIVVLTLPLNMQTRHLINEAKLEIMPKGSVLINVSRGAVIDEVDLAKMVQQGKFRGVALDVFEEEPLPVESPLWDNEKVIITPHNSFVSDQVCGRLFGLIFDGLKSSIPYLCGCVSRNCL